MSVRGDGGGGAGVHKNRNRAPVRPLNFATLSLSSGGLGFLRPMPGTWGSLPPPAVAGAIAVLVFAGALDHGIAAAVYYTAISALLVASALACIVFGRYAESRFALPTGEPQKDAPEVVADETAGQAVALLVVLPRFLTAPRPIEGAAGAAVLYPAELVKTLAVIALAFLAFRAFDIVKPWPVCSLETLPHGWGVLLDDLAAGVYAAVAVLVGQWALLAVVP